MDKDEVRSVSKREARSGQLSYTEPVVLYESSKSRKVLVPYFIHRTHGEELTVKIQTYEKRAFGGEMILADSKSVYLNNSASRRLLEALRGMFAVAQEGDDGQYIIIKVSEGIAQFGEHDPKAVAAALTKALSQHEILEHLTNTELSEELSKALQTAIRLSDMRTAVARLREALNGGVSEEQFYQSWCEEHTWAFGNAYVIRDQIRNLSAGDSIDILLPSVITGFRDIVELKRPDMPVLNYDSAHKNYYFSSDASKAIGQVQRYLEVLQDVAAKGMRDHPEIVAYHPRAIVVIGRSNDWNEAKYRALHALNYRLLGITIITYDHLLAQGERVLELLEHPAGMDSDLEIPEDDIPF